MKTIFRTGTMLMICGFCLNTVAAEHQVQAQQPDRIISQTGQQQLQDSKQQDRSAHKMPGKVQDVSNGSAPSTDDDCD